MKINIDMPIGASKNIRKISEKIAKMIREYHLENDDIHVHLEAYDHPDSNDHKE